MRAATVLALAVAGRAAAQEPAGEGEGWWSELADAGPGVHVVEVDSMYRVRGLDYDDLLREMRRKGPGGEELGTRLGIHLADWRWSYTYRMRAGTGRCRVAEATVLLRSVIVRPDWVDAARAPREIAHDWPRFLAALLEHEMGHRRRARMQGVALWQSLLGLQAGSCEALEMLVRETADRVIAEGEADQEAYDRDTEHGIKQGAVWPP